MMKKNILKNVLQCIVLLFGAIHPVFAIDIKGRVVNAGDGQAAEFANVVLRTADSAFVGGTVTDNEGRFSLTKVEQGDYHLVISSVGSETLIIELNGSTKDISLDEILLEEAAQALDAVTVTASRMDSRIDRKIVVPSPKQLAASVNVTDETKSRNYGFILMRLPWGS